MGFRWRFQGLCIPFLLGLYCPLPSFAQNPDYNQFEKRLRALEKRTQRSSTIQENTRTVKSFLDTNLTFGGFFETAMTGIVQSGRDIQFAPAASNTLGINIAADLSEEFRFATQFRTYVTLPIQNENGDARGSTVGLPNEAEFGSYSSGTVLSQGYLEWSSSESFNLQAGTGYVPYGIALQQPELVLFVRRGGPQLLRTQDLVSPVWQGIHFHGSFQIALSRWGYDAYTFSSLGNTKIPGAGGRFWWHSADEHVNAGISTQATKRNLETFCNVGTDIKLRYEPITVTIEASKSNGAGEQPWTAYVRTDFDAVDQTWILYLFADYLNHPNNKTGTGTGALSDPYRKWEYGGGLNWLPTSFTRLRAGVTANDYVYAPTGGASRNYLNFDLSAGIAF